MHRRATNFYRFLGAVLGLFLLMAGPASGSAQLSNAPRKLRAQAQTFLRHYLHDVVNRENFQAFGFVSYRETRAARVGNPYQVMVIPLKGLKNYQQGAGLKSLWLPTGKWWFPVLVKGGGRTKMEVLERNGRYLAGEFGGAKTAREILNVRSQLSKILSGGQIIATDVKLVVIPALKANFLFVEHAQGEFLISCLVHPHRYNLENGALENPDALLTVLRSYAQNIGENLFR